MSRATTLLVATIATGALYVAAAVALGHPPEATDDGAEVAAWFRDHDGDVRLWLWLLTLSFPLFATAAVLIRSHLPEPHRDLFLFGAIAYVAETAVQGWIWAGLAWHADELEPAAARTLLDVANHWGPVLTSATLMMLAPVALLALAGRAGLPRWLGALAAVAAAEQLVETITIFGDEGFIAPGGAMNLQLGAGLVGVTFVCLGVVVARAIGSRSASVEGRRPGN